MKQRSATLWAGAMVLLCVAGCGSTPVRRPAAQLEPKPFLLHLPGITGGFWMHDSYCRALNSGGFDAETAIYDWTGRRFGLAALAQREQNLVEAEKVARMLTRKHRAAPDRPLYLSCESGGAGVAIWALERLPEDVQVDAVVIVSPAVSTEYDLSNALRHVRQKMLVFPSKSDGLVLGIGTAVFGTMDRQFKKSAGLDGFVRPPSGDVEQYAKLEQFPYRGKMLFEYGNGGGHAWALYPHFASAWLAPRLIDLARDASAKESPSTQPASSGYASTR
jgi:hypothetical protein